MWEVDIEYDERDEENDDDEDYEEEEEKEEKEEKKNPDDFVNTMVDDVLSLYKTGRLSDVTFVVGKEEAVCRAHKLVLASASPIFEQMLFPNELHKDEKLVSAEPMRLYLPDVDVPSFKILMQSIYTDKVEISSKTLGNALSLARRYCCEKLVLECTDFLERGVSEENVCNYFNYGQKIAGDPNFGVSFILKKTKKIFATDGFLELFPEKLSLLLGHPEMSCREAFLLEKLIDWGKAKVEADDEDPDDISLVRKYIGDMLQHIRFPLMNLAEFTLVVSRSELLSDEELVDLYTYIAARDGKVAATDLPKLDPKWSTEKRGSSTFTFNWERCGNNSVIKDDGKTHASQGSGYSCAIADTVMSRDSGSYYWEYKIVQCSTSGWSCAVGVATQAVNLNNYLSSTSAGWGYFNQGCRAHNSGSGSDYFGGKWGNPGDIVGCHYDSDAGTLSFYLNGKNQGVGFKGINEDVWPASHVNTGVTITINEEIDTVLTDVT